MNHNYSELLIELIEQIEMEQLPEDVLQIAKDSLLDFLGVAYAGAYECKSLLHEYLERAELDHGKCTVIGMGTGFSACHAALLNGISAHYFELDDGCRFGMVHLGAVIFPALLSGMQMCPADSEHFLRGVVTGYETAIRLASAIQPTHKQRGYHATGTCGCIGAAAALAVAWEYDHSQIAATITAAATSAAGLLEVIDDASQFKPFNAGRAAQAAVTAAMFGRTGMKGPVDVLGGKRGFFHVTSREPNEEWFSHEGEMEYVIRMIYRKPYASCRHCHSAVEAALKLRQNLVDCLDKISEIQVQTYNLAVYGHDHTEIHSVSSAKMSIPYSVAAALILNDGGMNSVVTSAVTDSRILKLAAKVRVVENPAYSKLVPAKRIAKVIVLTKGGKVSECEVTYPKGEPENPMSKTELYKKFKQMAQHGGQSEERCNEIIYCVENIEQEFPRLLNTL